MKRNTARNGAMVAAAGLALATAPALAAPTMEIPPNTATKAAYHLSNGNTGVINLVSGDDRGDVPGKAPIVVSLGDSYISGEAGRWAGNADRPSRAEYADALGKNAYSDVAGAEAIPACHRSDAAEINFGAGTVGVNLSCSGATTQTDMSKKLFKPGVDDTNTQIGGVKVLGQTKLLEHLATANPGRIKMVVLSIGGNDFKFGPVVETCLKAFLGNKPACSKDPAVTALFEEPNVTAMKTAITGAIQRIYTAMTAAGYRDSQWTLLVQDYLSPIADSATIRYGQHYSRQFEGGCGLYNADLDWANDKALDTIDRTVFAAAAAVAHDNIRLLDLSSALRGHRLCEQNTSIVGQVGSWPFNDWTPVRTWKQNNASDLSEWVAQIRVQTAISENWGEPFQLAESLHPNYWGQLAYQSCLAQAFNGGQVRGGTCVPAGTGLDDNGRPKMTLAALGTWRIRLEAPDLTDADDPAEPNTVRRLAAKVSRSTATLTWRKPAANEPVAAYYYRSRDLNRRWSAWLHAGLGRSATLAVPGRGAQAAQVVAVNAAGTGAPATVRFTAR